MKIVQGLCVAVLQPVEPIPTKPGRAAAQHSLQPCNAGDSALPPPGRNSLPDGLPDRIAAPRTSRQRCRSFSEFPENSFAERPLVGEEHRAATLPSPEPPGLGELISAEPPPKPESAAASSGSSSRTCSPSPGDCTRAQRSACVHTQRMSMQSPYEKKR